MSSDKVIQQGAVIKESVADRMRRQARAFRAGRPVSGEQFPQVVRGSVHVEPDDVLVSLLCTDAVKHADLASLRGKYEARTVGAIPSAEVEQRVLADLTRPELGFEVRIERGEKTGVIFLAWP